MLLILNVFNFLNVSKCAVGEGVSECTDRLILLNTTLNELEEYVEENLKQNDFMVKEVNSLTTLWLDCLKAGKSLESETNQQIKSKNEEMLKEIYTTICGITDKFKSVDFAENIKQEYEQLKAQNTDGSKDEEIKQLKIKIKEMCKKIDAIVNKIFVQAMQNEIKMDDPLFLLSDHLIKQSDKLHKID
ncbi:hypothetical protein EHP00_2704 [Ecytonucleospora hepatopenaei]|uniref:Uncharacterized protein n=1 Tax=Ecytonucleospora hepatopenaei TaxID=646526 RepID=A0A1W0E7W1_9MICR|nr:hypothetical protein EHP00_774 [Ecytonucleospora hepatopenaei]OQS55313.1 hypothetical protein EHP00_2704 [Ecytonucleospora hepatopenaei]